MMKISTFELERYFAKHEFSAPYLLSNSDCEALSMSELLEMADAETTGLWEDLTLGYTESSGHPLLRSEIACLYEGLTVEEILVAVPEEGIFLLMHAVLEPGDHVVCTFPAYQSLHEVARSIGCRISTWEPVEERGWHFDLTRLEELLEPETRLVVVNFPHNPTGHVPLKDDFEALVTTLRQRDILLFSDEMYRFLEVEPDSTLPSACEIYDRAFSLHGLSKAFGLPGLRIGWIASRNRKVLERISELKDYTTICASAPSELLAIMALRKRESIIADQTTRITRNLSVLDEFFEKFKTYFTWNRPIGGSICFPRLLVQQGASEFCEDLVSHEGIMLVPSKVFQFGDRHVRIGFGRENLPEVITRFSNYLDRGLTHI